MKPPPFEVCVVHDVDDAVRLLATLDGDVKVLAGGQSLVPLMSFRLARPDVLVDVNGVDALAGIARTDGELRIGAMTRQRDVERSSDVAAACPLLSAVLPYVAHSPIRNRGTIGGSVAHADPSAEICAALLALGGRVRVRNVTGERDIAVDDLFVGPFSTQLADDELLTDVVVPAQPSGSGWAFAEVARRRGDFAMVGTAAVLHVDDGVITDARLAYMSMAPTPVRATSAEAALVGQPATADAFARAASIAREELSPSDDLHAHADYRRHVAAVLTRRTLTDAAARAGATG